mmetsp:Transcript_29673/g.87842  ORF Transcript_29673/g.87842 Transcript_29673/m.87842 type:complete len:116 (-) Transcript_29673:109-456(-)
MLVGISGASRIKGQLSASRRGGAGIDEAPDNEHKLVADPLFTAGSGLDSFAVLQALAQLSTRMVPCAAVRPASLPGPRSGQGRPKGPTGFVAGNAARPVAGLAAHTQTASDAAGM